MYFAPYIDGSGVHLPTYEDRLDALLSSYRSIFGLDANLEPSAPDYQLLSVFARALDDLSELILVDFASRNPQHASGAGLDLLMPLYGLTRQGATHSSVPLTLTGTPEAVLPSAPRVLDDAGYIWACQTAGIRLNESGTALVSAICETPGAVSAAAGSVSRLVAPVAGLSSAVNLSAATPGVEAETDASCRNRLKLAASAPAMATIDAIRTAVLAVPNVTHCVVYENDTDAADANGIPAHSISVVMAGGNANQIAAAVFAKKAPGIGTYGTLPRTVQDAYGVSHTVNLMRAVSDSAALTVELQPLAGFDADHMPAKMKAALAEYSKTIEIGQDVVLPSLYSVCYAVDTNPQPTFSISLISAALNGESTANVLHSAWNHRISFPEAMIQIVVASS